jgi:hypothetical protein
MVEMMDLEAVSALTAVGGAGVAVSFDDGPAEFGVYGPLASPVDHGGAVFGSGGDFYDGVAEESLEGLSADFRSCF